MSIPFILASSSPVRRTVLINAGIQPLIRVSHVNERDVIVAWAHAHHQQASAIPAYQRVMILADAKADAVYKDYLAGEEALVAARGEQDVVNPLIATTNPAHHTQMSLKKAIAADRGLAALSNGPLLLGCDSMFELDGVAYGKPGTKERAFERLAAMSGKTGTLWTGHVLINLTTGERRHRVTSATVQFAHFTDEEMRAYCASGEPINVAGSFALEGLGGGFITSVTGDPSGIIGVSLAAVRQMAADLGVQWTDLWNTPYALGESSDKVRVSGGTDPQFVFQPGDGWYDCACGHKHWGIHGAAGILLARRDSTTGDISEVVLQHRSPLSMQGGTWGAPGGAFADGESPYEGALRESLEEASIHPADIEIVGARVESHGEWKYTTLLALEKPGHHVDPSIGDNESLEIRWVPVSQVEKLTLLSYFREQWPGHLATLQQAAHEISHE